MCPHYDSSTTNCKLVTETEWSNLITNMKMLNANYSIRDNFCKTEDEWKECGTFKRLAKEK